MLNRITVKKNEYKIFELKKTSGYGLSEHEDVYIVIEFKGGSVNGK